MSDLPENLELKLLPDWLKEIESPANRYADFAGESPERRERDDRRGRGGPARGREERGPRGPRPGGDRPRPGGKRPAGGERRSDSRGPRHEERRDVRPPAPAPVTPAKVKVEFLPEPGMLAAIAREIKSSYRAFPLFGTAKLFLSKHERHCVRLTAIEADAPLFQLGDGPISTDRAIVERDAFRSLKEKYYREEVVQGEPPKGNYTNVARLRGSGLLLGPTNYHSYQPALRRIYEERFSKRMPFAEFQQREIEVMTGEQAVNDWKEQARSTVTYVTTQEAEPLTFKTLAEVEAHFRATYLPQEIKSGPTFTASGMVLRGGADRALGAALREAFDREFAFPAGVVNAMRPALIEAGLTFFKHRKRIVYACTVRPHRYPEGQPARDNVIAILKFIEAKPRCARHDLALKLLGENFDAPEKAEEKTALAADLHYLIHAGHVIEFADGRFDLPLPPKAHADAAAKPGTAESEETAEADESPTATPDAVAASEPAPPVAEPEVTTSVETATPPPPLVSVSSSEPTDAA